MISAIVLGMSEQHPDIYRPSTDELLEIARDPEVRNLFQAANMNNINNFTADQGGISTSIWSQTQPEPPIGIHFPRKGTPARPDTGRAWPDGESYGSKMTMRLSSQMR